MSTKTKVDQLWRELRDAINKAYDEHGRKAQFDDDFGCLRDYAEDISWSDDLAGLLGRESANERQHRSNRPVPRGFSVETAAKLILLNNFAKGAELSEMPKATAFLVLRKTAVEAEVIGFIIKDYLSADWRAAVNAMDYAELMKAV